MNEQQIIEILRQKMPGYILAPTPQFDDISVDSVNQGSAEWAGVDSERAVESETSWEVMARERAFAYRGYPELQQTVAVRVRPENDPSQEPIEVLVSSDGKVTVLQG